MSCFVGVSHPLRYTSSGDVAREEDGAVENRIELMQRAGVEWVLCDIPFPFEGTVGRASDAFRNFGALLQEWHRAGFKVLGVTPYPAGFEEGWSIDAGRPGGAKFLRVYEEACRFLAAEYAETVQVWVIGNQLNLERFRRPMTEDEAVELMKRGGSGVKRGNPDALAGVNMFGSDRTARRMYLRLYPNDAVEFDYVGTNGFFGTYDPGGPDTWHEQLAVLKEMTGKPVIVLECGYPSRGEPMTADERASGRTHHEYGKLPYVWRDAHSPEEQAAYLERAFWIFTGSPDVKGAFWFSWSDRPKCWNCGRPDCPAGTANGLVDLDGKPKPAYHAFGRVARGEFDLRALYPEEFAGREAGTTTAFNKDRQDKQDVCGSTELAEVRSQSCISCTSLLKDVVSSGRRREAGEGDVALARRLLEAERLRAEVACLRRILGSRDARLEKMRASLPFRLLRFLMGPLARLASRR